MPRTTVPKNRGEGYYSTSYSSSLVVGTQLQYVIRQCPKETERRPQFAPVAYVSFNVS